MDSGWLEGVLSKKRCLVGFDGFVDIICRVVDKRFGQGVYDFDKIQTISLFADRISSAAGLSTNIEIVHVDRRLGGNGPILCNALKNFGAETKYIGAIGEPIDSVFEEFAQKNNAISLGSCGETHAIEFDDGKLLFGSMSGMLKIDVDTLRNIVGVEPFTTMVDDSDLVAIANWTMMPHLTGITRYIYDVICPKIAIRPDRIFFFDLADPAKRSVQELHDMLDVIANLKTFGSPVLGVNLNEAKQVSECLGDKFNVVENDVSVKYLAKAISSKMSDITVFVHTNKMCAAANGNDVAFVTGYECSNPVLSTGAGDNFNAGFLSSMLCGGSLEESLHCGSATARFYVENGKLASCNDMLNLIQK